MNLIARTSNRVVLIRDVCATHNGQWNADLAASAEWGWGLRPTHRFKYFEAGELAKLIFDQLRMADGKPV
jgi:hypothetical protein